jgi:hypothetical protein
MEVAVVKGEGSWGLKVLEKMVPMVGLPLATQLLEVTG